MLSPSADDGVVIVKAERMGGSGFAKKTLFALAEEPRSLSWIPPVFTTPLTLFLGGVYCVNAGSYQR